LVLEFLSMGKRAAVVFTVLAVAVLQWLASDAQPPQQHFVLAPHLASQPRMSSPQMMASSASPFFTAPDKWDYEVPSQPEDVQRRVMERLFRKPPPAPAMTDPSKDAALQMAAKEVFDIAGTFGQAEKHFADKWLNKVMATEDPKDRLDILDECFLDMTLDCQGLENALRRFRMLLAPHTAVVKVAKQHVRELAVNFDDPKKKLVEAWMTKVEKGDVAEDPSQVLDECEVSSLMGGARSRECFEFEDALRSYKAAADIWATPAD
jgi:hypothetical protein